MVCVATLRPSTGEKVPRARTEVMEETVAMEVKAVAVETGCPFQ